MGGAKDARSNALLVHAFGVGISWFVIGLPFAIVVMSNAAVRDSLADFVRSAPLPITTGVAAVLAPFAFPYLWPVYMAVGAFEARLSFAMRAGSEAAPRTASRMLLVQAAVYLALGCGLARWLPGNSWVVPALMGGLHVALAHWIRTNVADGEAIDAWVL